MACFTIMDHGRKICCNFHISSLFLKKPTKSMAKRSAMARSGQRDVATDRHRNRNDKESSSRIFFDAPSLFDVTSFSIASSFEEIWEAASVYGQVSGSSGHQRLSMPNHVECQSRNTSCDRKRSASNDMFELTSNKGGVARSISMSWRQMRWLRKLSKHKFEKIEEENEDNFSLQTSSYVPRSVEEQLPSKMNMDTEDDIDNTDENNAGENWFTPWAPGSFYSGEQTAALTEVDEEDCYPTSWWTSEGTKSEKDEVFFFSNSAFEGVEFEVEFSESDSEQRSNNSYGSPTMYSF